MKNRYKLIGLLFPILMCIASCIDDKGNYDYTDPAEVIPITISGFNDTTIVRHTVLKIEPIVENITDENRYSHLWYTIPTTSLGGSIKRDTLARTKNLEAEIKSVGAIYYLYYEIRDIQSDVYIQKRIQLTVNETDITTGWYILKDIDNQTDFDYINTKDNKRYNNVLKDVLEYDRLKGKAIKMVYQMQGYSHEKINEDGTVTVLKNQSIHHILSTEDFRTYSGTSLELFKNYEDQFYGPVEKVAPQNIVAELYGHNILINSGKVHTISGYVQNIGKFSAPKIGIYGLHSGLMLNMDTGFIFDTISHSFRNVTPLGTGLDNIPAKSGMVPLTNMKARLLDLLQQDVKGVFAISKTGFALMQSLDDSEEYYVGTAFLSIMSTTDYPFTAFDTIPRGYLMPRAQVKAAPDLGSFIYFANDNKLYAHKLAKGLEGSDREFILKEFPADEKISHIKNLYIQEGSRELNLVGVVTNNANGWKLYCFELGGRGNPEFRPEPIRVFEGEGFARYIMVRF